MLSDSRFFLHVIFTLSFYLSLVVTCGSFYRIRWMFILIAAGDFCLLIDRFYRFRLFSLLLLVLRNNCWRMNEFRLGCFPGVRRGITPSCYVSIHQVRIERRHIGFPLYLSFLFSLFALELFFLPLFVFLQLLPVRGRYELFFVSVQLVLLLAFFHQSSLVSNILFTLPEISRFFQLSDVPRFPFDFLSVFFSQRSFSSFFNVS